MMPRIARTCPNSHSDISATIRGAAYPTPTSPPPSTNARRATRPKAIPPSNGNSATAASPCRSADQPSGEVETRQPAIGFEIALAGGVHDFRRQLRRRSIAVPSPGVALDIEPVAQRLLVEAGLRLAWRISIERPEARAVGRHHLVDQQDLAVLGAPELELGVGDDDAVGQRNVTAVDVDDARQPLELSGDVGAQDFPHAADGDVLVMAALGLGGRAEDRRLDHAAFLESGGKLLAGQGAALGIFAPRRAREIAADHALDREYRAAQAQHGATHD